MKPFIYLTIVVYVMHILDSVVPDVVMEKVDTQPNVIEVAAQSERQIYELEVNGDWDEIDPASFIGMENITELLTLNGDNLVQFKETVNEFGDDTGYPNVSVSEVSLSRQRRHDACPIPPDSLSRFDCTIGETYKSCLQTCAWGYRVEGRRSIRRRCSYKTGRWCPKFQPCKPFERCNLRLVSAGNVSCSTNHMDHGPRCTISCGKTKRHPEINVSIECKEGGRWSPKPPHCVRAF